MKYRKIFKKYIENKASRDEIESLGDWLKESKNGDKKLQEFISSEWEEYVNTDGKSAPELEKILENIHEQISYNENKNSNLLSNRPSYKRKKLWPYISGIAAAVIFICAFLWVDHSQKSKLENEKPLTEVKSNPKGQKSTIALRDGSRVKLNADSELSFPETFEDNKRVVYLKGEAFFEVAKDASRPFIVVTENITTTAVGTSFNVKAFPGQKDIKITLATGKVLVTDQDRGINDQLFLLPNERATFIKSNITLVKDQPDIEEELAWTEGVLYFRDADLMEISEKLERWFNVQVMVTHPERWGKRSFTGQFDNESLEHVIKGMSYSSRFNYNIEGRIVNIKL